MTQAQPKLLTFKDFLAYDDGSDCRYELLTNGDLVPVTAESELNSWIAKLLSMAIGQVVSPRLVRTNSITVEVTPIGDGRKNRYPDLIVLQPEHIGLMRELGYGAITLDMPPPQMVAEVVSPGRESSDNYRRDYEWKRQQYQMLGISEYWILDPQRKSVTVFSLVDGEYQQTLFRDNQQITSIAFTGLRVSVDEILSD